MTDIQKNKEAGSTLGNQRHASGTGSSLYGKSAMLLGSAFVSGGTGAIAQESADENVHVLPTMHVDGQSFAMTSPKFTRPLLETPRTVSVITENLIEYQNATTLRDVLRNTPGITFQAGEGGAPPGDNLFIRGFAARNDLFVDGVRDSGQYARDPFNLEQVEVLKGPSSAELGRGVTGGAVNQASKTPKNSDFHHADLSVGTDSQRRATIDVNERINEGSGIAARLNAMWTEGGVPGRDEVENSRWGVAPSLAWGMGKPTSISVGYLHLEQDNLPDFGLPGAAYTDPAIDWSNFYGLKGRDYEDIRHDSLNTEIRHSFDDHLTLRNLTRYSKTTRDAAVTSPRLVANDPLQARRNDVKTQDRENQTLANLTNLHAHLTTGQLQHEISAGAEVSREKYVNHARAVTGDSPVTDLYNPTPSDPWTGSISRTGAYTDTVADTLAFYLFDSVDLSRQWQLHGGLRWERFSAETDNVAQDGSVVTLERTDKKLSWSAGLIFKPVTNGSIYASYGTSFNPSAEDLTLAVAGGRGGTSPAANHPNLAPEETKSIEVGTKWELLDQKLTLSTAVFQTVKDNARTRSANDEPYVLAGEQEVRGVELGIAGALTSRWSVFGGYAYMETEIKESLNELEQNHELPYAPKHTLNLWTQYQLTERLMLGGGAQFTGEYHFSTTADDASIPDSTSYWLFNAMVQYQVNDNLSLRLNAENLTDERYVERGYGAHFTPGASRAVTLTASLSY